MSCPVEGTYPALNIQCKNIGLLHKDIVIYKLCDNNWTTTKRPGFIIHFISYRHFNQI